MCASRYEGTQLRQNVFAWRAVQHAALQRRLAVQCFDQCGAAAGHPAFHGADRRAANLCGLFVGNAAGGDQDQRIALMGRQAVQGVGGIGKFGGPVLLVGGRADCIALFGIPLRLAPAAARGRNRIRGAE